eukprot:CAMPEP_0170519258 /NCGR_PEP_ID=MMETSP0209-20121228/4749_1 /TAXON_ID=665100 ORGANISM="Litonotus pictus, Strain P1" /NCGR_SAMPLE_ID=MMETSP0209 /ASSEMBLY_ACC=CAM_ASM_000301 /LENGTH=301 /DNA_ID=CAMNT_0010805107 /DNA_START=352 /DNA_END=1254 /DNA_ORIENTATION=+
MIDDYGGWVLDFSGIYMMSVVKFSSFAFSYEDGGKPDSEIKNGYMKEKKIVNPPTFLESMSFFFHFSSCIIGPSIEFADYRRFIYLEEEYENIPIGKVCLATLRKLFMWLVYSAAYLGGSILFPIPYLLSQEFYSQNFFYKITCLYITTLILRTKYYTGWTLSQTGMTMSGLTYKKTKTETGVVETYDKAICFDFWGVEIEPSPKKKITKWNITVHHWLKYSVFLRLKNKEDYIKFLNSISPKLKFMAGASPELITFMVSAFWHGFYPNYYIFFFFCFIVEQISALIASKTKYFDYIDTLW